MASRSSIPLPLPPLSPAGNAAASGSGEPMPGIRRLGPASGQGLPSFGWPSDELAFLAEILRAQHVPAPLIERLNSLAALPPRGRPEQRLASALGSHFRFLALDDMLRLPALLLVGYPGSGKTALAAKLAARLDPRRALVVSADAGNVGGLAQLEQNMRVLGAALAVAEDAEGLRSAVAGAEKRTVIIDTPGVTPGDEAGIQRLKELKEAARAEPVLVLPADLDAQEAAHAAIHAASIGAKLMVAMRMDLVRRAGAVLAAADAGHLSPVAASQSAHFAYGLSGLTPEMLARRLVAGALGQAN
jgi:flagellar biosynthesis protein FlhF